MVKRSAHTLKQAVMACLTLVVTAVSAAAATDAVDHVWRQKLREFDMLLQQQLPDPSLTAQQLIVEAGFGQFAAPSEVQPTLAAAQSSSGEMLVSKVMDMRLALALVSQIYGAKDNFDVLYAQPDQSYPALVFDSGIVTVDAIFAELDRHGLQTDGGQGRGFLQVPVIVWGDAKLHMTQGDALVLSRSHGAYLINFGRAELNGATIRAEGEPAVGAPDFVPFFANAGGASVVIRNSTFEGLGFGGEMKFSGFSVVRNPMLVRKDQVVVENNTFIDVVSVAIGMADNAVLRNNRIHNARGASLIVTHSAGTQVVGNLISGKTPTNAIRVLQGSVRTMIAGNVILGGDRSGIAVRNDSNRVSVINNVVWQRGGAGISTSNLTCGSIRGNLVIDNRQKGIEVRSSRSMIVQDNTVISNRSAGIWVTGQLKDEPTLLQGNVLIANGSGVASTTGERLVLTGNNFTRQFPQFVSGDLARLGQEVARNLRGETPMILSGAGLIPGPLPDMYCPD